MTILMTLTLGVEVGVSAGVGLSILLHLYKSSKPHIAEVGQIAGTEHYRNILRHNVVTDPTIFTLRVDESLYFANAHYLEDKIQNRVAKDKTIHHVILQFSAINDIDLSALESLKAINERLREMDVQLHLYPAGCWPLAVSCRWSVACSDGAQDCFLGFRRVGYFF